VWACSAHPHLALARTAQCFQGRVNARQRAQIVLLAADGAATREISWQVGCTIGTASKWRVRYAWDRLRSRRRLASGVPSRSMARREATPIAGIPLIPTLNHDSGSRDGGY
jgi:hypothetical protein